jgi:GR25 family glycosyltransferase involved in LPS biosynthesis
MISIELVVVACRKRPAIVLPFLENIAHRVHWTTDYELPEGWKIAQEYSGYLRHQKQYVGHLRCFRGHADALKDVKATCALVLEDDAVPNRDDWVQVVAQASRHMEDYDVISLHGRSFHPEHFSSEDQPLGVKLLTPGPSGQRWVQGSLAYLIRMDAAQKLINHDYNGYPIDIFLCNEFKRFGLINPSPFNHGHSRSLIDA